VRSPARNRRKAQYAAFEEARRAKWDTPTLSIPLKALQFAFAVIVNGGRHSQILQIMSFLDIVVPGERTYYRAQSTFYRAIVELAAKSYGEWRENVAPHSVVVVDRSSSQRPNASHYVVGFIGFGSGKSIDFEFLKI
jgi:hypothetical protein